MKFIKEDSCFENSSFYYFVLLVFNKKIHRLIIFYLFHGLSYISKNTLLNFNSDSGVGRAEGIWSIMPPIIQTEPSLCDPVSNKTEYAYLFEKRDGGEFKGQQGLDPYIRTYLLKITVRLQIKQGASPLHICNEVGNGPLNWQ